MEHYKEEEEKLTVDKLLVDYIIGNLEFDGWCTCFIMYYLQLLSYNYVMEYTICKTVIILHM